MKPNELLPEPVKILDIYQESSDLFTFTLDTQRPYSPGQFIQVSLLGIGEAPISISSYSKDFLKVSIRVVGNVTQALSHLKKGDTLFIRGPYGKGYPFEQHFKKNVIFIGGGCGVAPLKGAIDYVEAHRSNFKDVYLFLAYRSFNDIIFKRELGDWKEKYSVQIAISEKPKEEVCYTGNIGYITGPLEACEILKPKEFMACICGPPKMMESCVAILQKKGIQGSQIFVSAERLMECAIGQCCHCMIHGKFVCTDGPVFSYEELKKEGEI